MSTSPNPGGVTQAQRNPGRFEPSPNHRRTARKAAVHCVALIMQVGWRDARSSPTGGVGTIGQSRLRERRPGLVTRLGRQRVELGRPRGVTQGQV